MPRERHCSFDPLTLAGQPIGMLHCPECGAMVLAAAPHPRCSPDIGHHFQDGQCINCGVVLEGGAP